MLEAAGTRTPSAGPSSTDRGDRIAARYLVLSSGPFNRPKLPAIPGVNEFKGYTFHTSRWDYAYTGGDSVGGLPSWPTSASASSAPARPAIQCIPHLAEAAEHLYVFQRTPSSVEARNNRETDPEWCGSLEPGWQERRMNNFVNLVNGGEEEEDLVADGWTDIFREISVAAIKKGQPPLGRRLTSDGKRADDGVGRLPEDGPRSARASTGWSRTRRRPRG